MNRTASLTAALQLTRPAQWPILTAQLVVSMLLTAPVAGDGWSAWFVNLPWWRMLAAWVAWVVLLNGGTLAFNSAYDRDTEPVAYLACPPQPPGWLARAAVVAMGLGGLLGGLLVGPFFGLAVFACLVLSVLYSHPATRWKSRPGLDLMVNIIGYGAGTTIAGMIAVTGEMPAASGWWFTAGFGLLFGSFYPLTQIYQTDADRRRGDRTLTTALGIRPSLLVTLGLGLTGGAALLQGCLSAGRLTWWGLLAGGLGLWCGHAAWWLVRADHWRTADHERAMYRALMLWAVIDTALALVWLRG